MQAKKQYTDEFKKEAIHLLETSGKTVTEITVTLLSVMSLLLLMLLRVIGDTLALF